MIRAKFKVSAVTSFENDQKEVQLNAVSGGSPENQSFNKYTPRGELKMVIDNPDLKDFFSPGEEVFLDFVKA